jgi:hypothetical protein
VAMLAGVVLAAVPVSCEGKGGQQERKSGQLRCCHEHMP